jgi:hypothetical protein
MACLDQTRAVGSLPEWVQFAEFGEHHEEQIY